MLLVPLYEVPVGADTIDTLAGTAAVRAGSKFFAKGVIGDNSPGRPSPF